MKKTISNHWQNGLLSTLSDDLLIIRTFCKPIFFFHIEFFWFGPFRALGLATTMKNCDALSSHHALYEGLAWK